MSLPKTIASFVGDSVLVDIDELHWFQGELKSLDKNDFDKLRTSIIEEGVIDTVNVWENEKKQLMILDGHQTKFVLNSLRADGYSIPKVKATKILAPNFKKAKAYVLLMSSTYGKLSGESLSQYFIDAELDFTELSKKLDLPGVDLDLEDFNVSGGTEGLTDEDEIPEVVEPKAKLGDIYKLGNHRLMCGDSTSEADVARLMDGEKAQAWISDPPYGINHVEVSQEKGQSIGYKKIANDDLEDEALKEFILKTIETSKPHLEKGFAFYMWHAMKMQAYFSQAAAAAAAAGILFHRQIIWKKERFVFGRGHYHWQHELCLMGWLEGNEPPFYGERNQTTVWSVSRENDKIHPTQKPVELYEIPIKNHLKPGQGFMEPFGGSGAGIIAAEKTGVCCFCMEFEPSYVDVIIARWEAFTGKTAELISQSES